MHLLHPWSACYSISCQPETSPRLTEKLKGPSKFSGMVEISVEIHNSHPYSRLLALSGHAPLPWLEGNDPRREAEIHLPSPHRLLKNSSSGSKRNLQRFTFSRSQIYSPLGKIKSTMA
jgi:hypothetical protein